MRHFLVPSSMLRQVNAHEQQTDLAGHCCGIWDLSAEAAVRMRVAKQQRRGLLYVCSTADYQKSLIQRLQRKGWQKLKTFINENSGNKIILWGFVE